MLATLTQLLPGGDVPPSVTAQYHCLWSLTPTVSSAAGCLPVIVVAKRLRVGLELLLHPELGQNLSDAERIALIQKHQRPHNPTGCFADLWEVTVYRHEWLAWTVAMVWDALVQLCQASGVGKIDCHRIPIPVA